MQARLRTLRLLRTPLFRKTTLTPPERHGDLLDLDRLKGMETLPQYEQVPERPSADWKVKA